MLNLFKYSILILSISLAKSDVSHLKEVVQQQPYHHTNSAGGGNPIQYDSSQQVARTSSGISSPPGRRTPLSQHQLHNFAQNSRKQQNDDEHWDIRFNIPGEPGIDYPIYSVPPDTSFTCHNKHDGYYADVEARCQVFRVCGNTDLTGRGFAFLCPNGTLFNQKYFVCDWYRNVDCTESENFYFKNNELGNLIGSLTDMMSTVQRMKDYTLQNTGNGNIDTTSGRDPFSSTALPIGGGVQTNPIVQGLLNNGPAIGSGNQFPQNTFQAQPGTGGGITSFPTGTQSPRREFPNTSTQAIITPVGIGNGLPGRPRKPTTAVQQQILQNQLTGQTLFAISPESFLGVQPPPQAYRSATTSSLSGSKQGNRFNFKTTTPSTQSDQNFTATKLVLPYVINSLGEVRAIDSGFGDLLSQTIGQRGSHNKISPEHRKLQNQSTDKTSNEQSQLGQGGSVSYRGSGQISGSVFAGSLNVVGQNQQQEQQGDVYRTPIYTGSGDLLGQTIGHHGTPVQSGSGDLLGHTVGQHIIPVQSGSGDLLTHTIGQHGTPVYSGSGDLLGHTVGQHGVPVQSGSGDLLGHTIGQHGTPVQSGSGDLLGHTVGQFGAPVQSGSGDLLGHTIGQHATSVQSGSGDLLGHTIGTKAENGQGQISPVFTGSGDLLGHTIGQQPNRGQVLPVYSGSGDLLGQTVGQRGPNQIYTGTGDLLSHTIGQGTPGTQTDFQRQSIHQSVSTNVSYSQKTSYSSQSTGGSIQPENQLTPGQSNTGKSSSSSGFFSSQLPSRVSYYTETNSFSNAYSETNQTQSYFANFAQVGKDYVPVPTTYTITEQKSTSAAPYYSRQPIYNRERPPLPARGYLPSKIDNHQRTTKNVNNNKDPKQVYTYPEEQKSVTTDGPLRINLEIDVDLTNQTKTNRDVSKQERSFDTMDNNNDKNLTTSLFDIANLNEILLDTDEQDSDLQTTTFIPLPTTTTNIFTITTIGKDETINEINLNRNETIEKSTNLLHQGVQLSLYEKRYFRQNRPNYINQLKNETSRSKPKPKDSKTMESNARGTRNTNSIKIIFERAKNRTNDYRLKLQQRLNNASYNLEQKTNSKRNAQPPPFSNSRSSDDRNITKVGGFLNNKPPSSTSGRLVESSTTSMPIVPVEIPEQPTPINITKIPSYLTRLFKRVILSDNTKPRTTTTTKTTTQIPEITPITTTTPRSINRFNSKPRDYYYNPNLRKYLSISQTNQQLLRNSNAGPWNQQVSPTPAASHTNYIVQKTEDRSDINIHGYQYVDTKPSSKTFATIANIPGGQQQHLQPPPIKSYYPYQLRNSINSNVDYRIQKRPILPTTPPVLPSVVHPVSFPSSSASFYRQQQQQQPRQHQQRQQQQQQYQQQHQQQQQHQKPKEQIIVKIVPSNSWYLNDENERKSYFEAVSRGLLNENGDVFVNKVQSGQAQSKSLKTDAEDDDDSAFFKGPSSYQLPLSSVGKLACDSDSVNSVQEGENNNSEGYQYVPPCQLGTLDYP